MQKDGNKSCKILRKRNPIGIPFSFLYIAQHRIYGKIIRKKRERVLLSGNKTIYSEVSNI